MSRGKIYNFITGEYEELPHLMPPEGPSEWWIEGWNSCMNGDPEENPYEQGTTEYWEWQDGYNEAQRD
jgi:hypothetical protein